MKPLLTIIFLSITLLCQGQIRYKQQTTDPVTKKISTIDVTKIWLQYLTIIDSLETQIKFLNQNAIKDTSGFANAEYKIFKTLGTKDDINAYYYIDSTATKRRIEFIFEYKK